jgi:hypothetical protein
MSNLGRYQEFTTAAKAAGGVDKYLRHIKAGAVLKAAPVLLAIGGVGGWVSARIHRKAQVAEATVRQIEIGEDEQ